MKRRLLSLIVWLAPLGMLAQGWPANYEGVMLQGFYWDSYEDAKWSTLTSQADELSSYFKLIWVPNSGQTKEDRWNSPGNWGYENMGYMPVYWLKHNTCFGSQEELMQMISTFKAKGTGFIEDVVINHKNGLTNWADFPNETVTGPTTGKTYTVTWADDMSNLWGICSNDEVFTQNNGYHDGVQYTCASGVAADEADNFDGCRDLDHTNAQVQNNIYNYLDFLLDELGYVGFRYDMVKGYKGYYVGLYNKHAEPEYSVGEYWDSNFNNVVNNWINETGRPANWTPQSAAFDFPLKYVMNDVFDNGNWSALSNKGIAGSPDWNRYAVTFVDNHDTYRSAADRVDNNVLAANAFILAMPGTPCVFLPHWKQYKPEIKKMIAARNAAGITNQSEIKAQYVIDNGAGYYLKVEGTKGSVILTLGNLLGRTVDTDQHTLVQSGDNFALYLWDGVYNAKTYNDIDEESAKDITVYVKQTDAGAPNLYAWNGGNKLNGEMPGSQVTETATLADGSTWYKKTLHTSSMNVIVSYNGSDKKSDEILRVTDDIYLCYYKGDDKKHADYTPLFKGDASASTIHAYFDAPSGWDKAWAWCTKFYDITDKNYTGGEWPGATMQQVGKSSTGNDIYRWSINKDFGNGVPNSIIFNNGSGGQTETLGFINAAYYNQSGVASGDRLYFYPQALANATSTTGTNWNGETGNLAENSGSTPMTQNIYFPAGDYTVQAIVRGTDGGQVTLSVGQAGGEATTSSVALTGLDNNAVSTVTTDGLVEEVVTGTNNGWHKVQAHYVLTEEGVLNVTLSSSASTWQVGAITIMKNADTHNYYRTTATTDVTQTNDDVTNMSNFSFYGRGANKNALVTAANGQEPASLPCNAIVGGQCTKLALTDGRYDFSALEDFTATAISYDRVFENGKKVTVCLPFAISADEMEDLGITAYDFDRITSSNVHFSPVEEMEANHPYVVIADGTPFASLGSRQVAMTSDLGVTVSGVTFQGTMKRTILSSNDNSVYYGYSNGSFVKVGSNVGVNPFRAYIKSATDLGAAVEAVFDEEADGIRDVQSHFDHNAEVYTIDGRKVENTTNLTALSKGMYVSKGRKFVVK